MEILEAINSLRSVRSFSPREIDDESVNKILKAATMAPSSSNSQPWQFIVIRSREVKDRVGRVFLRTWLPIASSRFARDLPAVVRRIYEASTEMVRNTKDCPLLILVCLDTREASRSEEARYASIYPAVQNLMLAAWSLGIGSCLTTNGAMKSKGEDEIKSMLGVPGHIKIAASIYMGYPSRKPLPPRRTEAKELTHIDRW